MLTTLVIANGSSMEIPVVWSDDPSQSDISQTNLNTFLNLVDIHGPKGTNPNDFGDSFSFHLAPPAGQNFSS